MIESIQQLSEPITICPIKNEADYESALEEIDSLMSTVKAGTPEHAQLEILSRLVEDYEEIHYPMGTPDPIAMIEFVLEARGLTRKDLEPLIGPRQRVWEVMEKHRRLTLPMIRRLDAGLGIPASVLIIQQYDLKKQAA
ncbi:MAG: transcriptional regulator [Caldilineaceae bacterium]